LICIKAAREAVSHDFGMKTIQWLACRAWFHLMLLGLCATTGWRTTEAADSATARKLFARPTREYSSGPLWVWNDLLTEQQIVETMRDLAGQQVKQVFVHPRPGLMTPYLSADWFRLWKAALKEAERLDMNVWIYDENSYPSGFAGGFVPELMPESRGRGLLLREAKTPPAWSDSVVAVHRLNENGAEDVSAQARTGPALPEGRYMVASVQRAGNSPWYGGRCYVDLLYPGVTEKFLEVTMEAYRKNVGDQFGKRIPGVFTDEPNIRPAGGLPWTDGLPRVFEARWGYDLLKQLPSLSQEVGDWRKVRHNYFQVLLEQFIERWAKPSYEYCVKHNLEWTGHYWEHEWPNCLGVTDNMAMYAWHQRPAIDCLMNQYAEGPHAQFGNTRAVRELGSVANQLGLQRTLCEAYGAGGWDLRFEDMKRIADWLGVLGVNTFDQHLSYITLRGARKRDHPQSFSYHEPWWEAYHVSGSYLERLTVAVSLGEQVNPVLVLEPTTTAWMYNSEAERDPRLKQLGETFQKLVLDFELAQIESDLGCEDIIARHGSASRGELKVGKRSYGTVVIPPLTENLNRKTVELLEVFLQTGGSVFCCGEPPARVDGSLSPRGAALAKAAGWKSVEPARLPEALWPVQKAAGLTITRKQGDKGLLFHSRRRLKDGQLLLLVNTSSEASAAGSVQAAAGGIEQWDLNTGDTRTCDFETARGEVKLGFALAPSGSALLYLSKKELKPAPVAHQSTASLSALGPPEVRRLEPNVLTLDYVDITAGGETRTNVYFYQANQFAFQKNGMDRNPWDSAVQFRDELIKRTFPAGSGFEASYRFQIDGVVPKGLAVVIERPDLYTITCNGQAVSSRPGAWWLDKAFGRIDLTSVARAGENVVTLKATPFTICHEIEPAYLLGEFSLRSAARGFVVAADRPLELGRWNEQGHPFYSAGVAYRQRFSIPRPSGKYSVSLSKWYGSVAKVSVNGKVAGYIAAPPWQCDVTRELRQGENTVEVTAIGTLKNTLGPHHGNPGLGSAWPGMFQRGPDAGPPPGKDYSTVGYGLFEPFGLQQITTEVSQASLRAP
jgi:hypothetical protein